MSFEHRASVFSGQYFLKEFTYSLNKLQCGSGQIELADTIIALDDLLFLFQIKERITTNTTAEQEAKWFANKVVKKAAKQMRETINYIESNNAITLSNQHGLSIKVKVSNITVLHAIILYKGCNMFSDSYKIKHHASKTVNKIMHIISESDYNMIMQTLITPTEISEYFRFRELLIDKYGKLFDSIDESAIIGQYLSGKHQEAPSNRFTSYFYS